MYVRNEVQAEDEALWNEAIVLEMITSDASAAGYNDALVVDPDGQTVLFDLSVPPLAEVRLGNGLTLPVGLGARHGAPVYRFARPDIPRGARFRELRQDAAVEKARLLREDPERYGDPLPDDASITGEEEDDPAHRRLPLASRRPPAVAASSDITPGLSWFCMETNATLAFGSPVPVELVSRIVGWGDRGAAPHPDGPILVRGYPPARAEVESAMALEDYVRALAPHKDIDKPEIDARCLPVERDSLGNRFRTWKSVAESLDQSELSGKFGLDGPRTAQYYCFESSLSGCGPVMRHATWKHENRLQDEDRLNLIHEMLSEFLELLGCVDQLDLSNLAGVEAICRNLQHTEHEIKKRVEKAGSEMSDWFLGRPRRAGGAIVSPDLVAWVSDKAQKRASILKEERKLATEQDELRKAKKGGGKEKS